MTRTYPKIQKSLKVSNNVAKMSKVSKKQVTKLECWKNRRIIFFTPAKMLKNYILQIWRILQFGLKLLKYCKNLSLNTAKPLYCNKSTCHLACCKPIWVIQSRTALSVCILLLPCVSLHVISVTNYAWRQRKMELMVIQNCVSHRIAYCSMSLCRAVTKGWGLGIFPGYRKSECRLL